MHNPRPQVVSPLLALVAIVILGGCATRTPADPSGNRGTFTPPTSPQIVLQNWTNAVAEKNTENYMLCLADETTRSNYPFIFEASAEAQARFQTLFDGWTAR